MKSIKIGAYAQILAQGFWPITEPIFVPFGYNFIYVFRRLVAKSRVSKSLVFGMLRDLACLGDLS